MNIIYCSGFYFSKSFTLPVIDTRHQKVLNLTQMKNATRVRFPCTPPFYNSNEIHSLLRIARSIYTVNTRTSMIGAICG